MNIIITGGSGYLGRALTQSLLTKYASQSIHVCWVSRNKDTKKPAGVNIISYDEFVQSDSVYDVVINLAGAGVGDARWSDKRKQLLYDSRLQPTQAVLNYLQHTGNASKLFISGSAIGWYGAQDKGDVTALTESSERANNDFAHQLCAKWETLALSAVESSNVPVALIRTGVVLSGDVSDGGMISRLKPPFLLGAGGRLADGTQRMSWISRFDWVRAVEFIIDNNLNFENQELIDNNLSSLPQAQVYNLTAPTPVTNADFTKAVGTWLKRPTLFSQPECVLKTLFGEMATLLIDSQNIIPQQLQEMGFEFADTDVSQALQR